MCMQESGVKMYGDNVFEGYSDKDVEDEISDEEGL